MQRRYEVSHPWITFRFDLNTLQWTDWRMLGEAQAKCDQIAQAILRPDFSKELHSVFLTKGVQGTTAIEGNTLSEEEVRRVIEGTLALPPSQEYLQREVENIVMACNVITREAEQGEGRNLTPGRLAAFNTRVLKDLPLEDGVFPGKIRQHPVTVLRYRGTPAEDCSYLVDQLCGWLNGPDFQSDNPDHAFLLAFAKAVGAHLYLAWIHPFGGGNGRTARLVEFQILVQSGVPFPAAHLLSNHYNRTRTRYYQVLDRSSRVQPYSVAEFFTYALAGFLDGLDEQLRLIEEQWLQVTWENYVNAMFEGRSSPAARRQRLVALTLPADQPTPRTQVSFLSTQTAMAYANRTPKTLTRDLNKLYELGLITYTLGGIQPNLAVLQAFRSGRIETIW